jgi:NAD(P)-dependent dehydrogenase (short-subunit alcohol dehydrogenase family)
MQDLNSSPGGLRGKVALVTGAGVRLGRAIARGLAREGCDLVLHYNTSRRPARELAGEIQALGRRAGVLKANLSKGAQALQLARAAEKMFGRVDVLVNSAAVFWATPLERLVEKEFNAFLDINLKTPYILCSEIGRRMKARGGGAIINMACVSAFRPWREFVPYSISKAGVVALTIGMAKLLAPEVRVNAVAPGTVLPPKGTPARETRWLAQRAPLNKIGTPADVVNAVLYLAQAAFVTGHVLCVDGGRAIV